MDDLVGYYTNQKRELRSDQIIFCFIHILILIKSSKFYTVNFNNKLSKGFVRLRITIFLLYTIFIQFNNLWLYKNRLLLIWCIVGLML